MKTILSAILIILFNLMVAYLISIYSYIAGIGWFCFAIGFQFGKYHGSNEKEDEFITREEMIREEYEQE